MGPYPVVDPALELRGGGGETLLTFLSCWFFSLQLFLHFLPKIRAGPGPFPGSATVINIVQIPVAIVSSFGETGLKVFYPANCLNEVQATGDMALLGQWLLRSTETQLICTIHDIASAIQSNKTIHAAILDFSKAFDKVPHRRLLKKLDYYGIRGPLHNWFESFLTQRTQSVVIGGESSAPVVTSSGVPQGTVLGPLLFLMYINDLPDGLNATVRLFADDALLHGTICCDEDTADLQDDLYRLEDWQQKWQMEFNPSKCKIMCFSTRRDPLKREYVFCGEILEEVECHRYLGVVLDNKMRWSPHVETITSKANKVLGLIKRNLWNCPKTVKETAYKSLVRPKLHIIRKIKPL